MTTSTRDSECTSTVTLESDTIQILISDTERESGNRHENSLGLERQWQSVRQCAGSQDARTMFATGLFCSCNWCTATQTSQRFLGEIHDSPRSRSWLVNLECMIAGKQTLCQIRRKLVTKPAMVRGCRIWKTCAVYVRGGERCITPGLSMIGSNRRIRGCEIWCSKYHCASSGILLSKTCSSDTPERQ